MVIFSGSEASIVMPSVDSSLGDLDGDGDLDAFVTNFKGQPNRVWLNGAANQSSMSAADLLATGEYDWQVEKDLGPPINSGSFDSGATMTTDRKIIALVSGRRDGTSESGQSLRILRRASASAQWSELEDLGQSIDLGKRDSSPNISDDGLSLTFIGGQKGQLYITKRDSLTSAWSRPILHEANRENRHHHTMSVTLDGLSIVITKGGKSETGVANYDLWLSRRTSPDERWSTPLPMGSPVNTEEIEADGTLSNDGRVLIFVRGWDSTNPDLWMTTRADWNAPWSDPVPIVTPCRSTL